MITRTTGYVSSDGTVHQTLEGAQRAELVAIAGVLSDEHEFADLTLKYRDKIIDILTTTSKSKPRARAVNGGTKKRKPKAAEASMFNEPPTPSAA